MFGVRIKLADKHKEADTIVISLYPNIPKISFDVGTFEALILYLKSFFSDKKIIFVSWGDLLAYYLIPEQQNFSVKTLDHSAHTRLLEIHQLMPNYLTEARKLETQTLKEKILPLIKKHELNGEVICLSQIQTADKFVLQGIEGLSGKDNIYQQKALKLLKRLEPEPNDQTISLIDLAFINHKASSFQFLTTMLEKQAAKKVLEIFQKPIFCLYYQLKKNAIDFTTIGWRFSVSNLEKKCEQLQKAQELLAQQLLQLEQEQQRIANRLQRIQEKKQKKDFRSKYPYAAFTLYLPAQENVQTPPRQDNTDDSRFSMEKKN